MTSPTIDMSADGVTADPLTLVREPVDVLLHQFLREREQELVHVDARLAPVAAAIARLVLGGGKRMRPAFVYWGYRATGASHTDALWHTAAAVELLQTFALIHDDVMDGSDTRRGQPAGDWHFGQRRRPGRNLRVRRASQQGCAGQGHSETEQGTQHGLLAKRSHRHDGGRPSSTADEVGRPGRAHWRFGNAL